jgi:hypothetical protein
MTFHCAVRGSLVAGLLTLAAPLGQAAVYRVGAQLGGGLTAIYPVVTTEFGLHASVQAPLNPGSTWQLRGVLEASALRTLTPGLGTAAVVRLDGDLLNTGRFLYYGAGLGSGLTFGGGLSATASETLQSALWLLNAHLVLGHDFGPFSLEGVGRVGALSGLSVRASIPLR